VNVLSLFDGISCGQIALARLGVDVNNYFASEIDKHAISITQKNFPSTIQLGDVREIDGTSLPKIDLLMGGSPCQGFSLAGKQLNFDDARSGLFFEFVRLLKECKPKYFLLENVNMKKESLDIISKYLNVEPVRINSNLVSAQNRDRYYWTNIQKDKDLADRGVVLGDILEVLDAPSIRFVRNHFRVRFITENDRGYRPHRGDSKSSGIGELGRILKKTAKKTNTLTATHAPKLALNSNIKDLAYRTLTPIECERLQTLPDNYTEGAGNAQRYKMIGNGWTIDVIAHIFKNIAR